MFKELEYKEVEQYLQSQIETVVIFEEYDTNLSLILRMSNFNIFTFVKENEFLDLNAVKKYYDIDYNKQSLCYFPYTRLILEDREENKLYPIHLNKISMDLGYQKLYVYEPNKVDSTLTGEEAWINALNN